MIDNMEKPMHFTKEQKEWVKNYIIINAKRQRADTINECIKIVDKYDSVIAQYLKEELKEY